MDSNQRSKRDELLRNTAIEYLGSAEEADNMLPDLIERLERRIANATQQCKGPCKRVLHISAFSSDDTANGLNRWCRECEATFRKEKSLAKQLKKEAKNSNQRDQL